MNARIERWFLDGHCDLALQNRTKRGKSRDDSSTTVILEMWVGWWSSMYLRFVISKKDEDSGCRLGIFNALYQLRNDGQLFEYEEAHFKEISSWFGENLRIPKKFTRSSSHNTVPKAISWFKDTAKEYISRMYDLKAILESHGISVDLIQSDNPGYIVYEDEFQVTAEPFQSSEA